MCRHDETKAPTSPLDLEILTGGLVNSFGNFRVSSYQQTTATPPYHLHRDATQNTTMPATRFLAIRPTALNGTSMASRCRTARIWQAQMGVQGKLQRAAYAIPPHDKHNDDLGGPYGQESPNPAERKKVNRYV